MQQLHSFDEVRNNQGMIRDRTAYTNKMMELIYFATLFGFGTFRLASIIKQMENGENRVFFAVRIEVKMIMLSTIYYL
jgi:hypothetical protein